MRLSDNRLNRLRFDIHSNEDYWYITKQECDFKNLCYIAEILSRWNPDVDDNYETFFNNIKQTEQFAKYIGNTAHRATINLVPYGLKSGAKGYDPKDLTEVFYKIQNIVNGDYELTSLYQNIIDNQLEKIVIATNSIIIYPMMFTFKVLLTLGDINGDYAMSKEEFKIFVATAHKWNEFFETVDSILRFRNDEKYKSSILASPGKKLSNDTRYNLVVANHSMLSVESNNISIPREFIDDVRLKIAKFEISTPSDIDIDLANEKLCSDTLENVNPPAFDKELPLQQIVFGAPGTGKSHHINIEKGINESNSIRTTFHPDSDYSSFVGCYKPTKKEKRSIIIPSDKLIEDAKNITGVANQVKFLCDNADSFINAANELNISRYKLIWESFGWHNETYFASFLELIQKERADFGGEITYEFCPQAFTNAYVNAWKNLDEPYYLIIEEINRGNCAQIFGDIFQLLDRDENGFSSYKITPDQDLANYLRSQFQDSDIDDEDLKSGCKMQLPNNLHIWATMNTSDQSLFPIDSAFKRRWDWKYMPIDYTDLGHYISCEDKKYSWSDFLEKVNEHIEATTQSEDKKLGYWFLARKNHNEITTELFVSKVIFYLWNDIFKDFATAGNSIFKDEYSKFHKFFDYSGNAKSEVVKKFLDNLGVISTNAEDENDESDSAESGALKFSLNGSQPISQRRLAQTALEEYLKNHSNYTAQQVIDDWKPLSNVPNFIITESEYLALVAKAPSWKNRAAKITLSNEEVVYISLHGWIPDTTWAFVNAINAKDWGINIKRAEA